MGNIRVKALFSHPRSCKYLWREYDAEALLQRATASHVVLFTELVPSPLTSPDSFHHYQAHNLTHHYYRYNLHHLTTMTTTTTTIIIASVPLCGRNSAVPTATSSRSPSR